MNPEEYRRMHELESHYWWFVGRREIVRNLLQETLKDRAERDALSLLDIGCGTGANLPMLAQAIGIKGRVTALDYSALALEFAQAQLGDSPSIHLLRSDATHLPFAEEQFDIVTMLDVLEHVEEDGTAVREIYRILKPGGSFILTVPAYQNLWSAHDEALHHFRRYEYAGLRSLLHGAGFQVWRQSFAMSLMPPIAWFWRRFVLPLKPTRRARDAKRHSEGAVLPQIPDFANSLLIRYLALEGKIIRQRPLKFGTSLVAIARKKPAKVLSPSRKVSS